MDIASSEYVPNQDQLNFFNDYCHNRYALKDLYNLYGEINVQTWVKEDWFINRWFNHKRQEASQNALTTEQWNNFKYTCYDIIAKALNGADITDAQLSTAKWILSGERSYVEAHAKAKGELSAASSDIKREPLEFIRLVKDEG